VAVPKRVTLRRETGDRRITYPGRYSFDMSLVTRCLVADNHPALAAAVAGYLTRRGYEVLGPVGDGDAALALAAARRPELALVDDRMPNAKASELVARLRHVAPETRVVVYTGDADASLVRKALEAGAHGVVLKQAPLPELELALESVRSGRRYVDPAFSGVALELSREVRRELTERELAVLTLLAEGLTHDAIGSRLSIGSETVRTHVRKASKQLGARTRTQAVATAIRLGLIS
jgi:DNA-binding NarL/FixJ family response regulator